MKIIIIFLLNFIILNSQSFDWEIDNRLPFKIPQDYIGLDVQYGINSHSGNINLNYNDIDIAQFNSGTGNNYSISVIGERWYLDNLTFNFKAGFSNFSDKFNQEERFPIFNGDILVLNYEYENEYQNINLSVGSKYRIFNKLNIGLNLNYYQLINSKNVFRQKILLPNWYTFEDGTKESILFDEENKNSKSFISYSINLSYDIQLSYPIYISPYINFENNLNSNLKNTDFNIYFLNFGLQFYYGIKLK